MIPSLAEILKYINLQLAAEALYGFDATKTKALIPGEVTAENYILSPAMLTTGNEHASRFTGTQAASLVGLWEVAEHKSNTATGFSGTLFRAIKDDPSRGIAKGDWVLSLRSTEFIDDAVRDNQATNIEEIKEHGWALGQIDDLEQWYETSLKDKIGTHQIAVTGYSLGGHLATAFNLMHQGDGLISQVVTYNAAGVGRIGDATGDPAVLGQRLVAMVNEFHERRTGAGGAALLQSLEGSAAYAQIKQTMVNGTVAANINVYDIMGMSSYTEIPAPEAVQKDYLLLSKAVKNIYLIQDYAAYVASLSSGSTDSGTPANPAQVPLPNVAENDLDYQLAMLTTANDFDAKPRSVSSQVVDMLTGGTVSNVIDGTLSNQVDIVGTETDAAPIEMTSGSQYHWGMRQAIFIEDQPTSRGSIVADAASSLLTNGVDRLRILDDRYSLNDFGDTHSLVLLVDSLMVQDTLLKLLPESQRVSAQGVLNTILKEASYLKAESTAGTQGIAEGDVLENVVNSLADLVLSPGTFTALEGKTEGNTWYNTDDREKLHVLLKKIVDNGANLFGSADSLNLTFQASGPGLAEKAKDDYGAFMALYSLSPFAFLGLTKNKPTTGFSGDAYAAWASDLDAEQPESRQITDVWLRERSGFLERKNWFGANDLDPVNVSYKAGSTTAKYLEESALYIDEASNYRIAQGFDPADPHNGTHVHYFGDSSDNEFAGKEMDDFLFGGDGNDTLSGAYGADFLQGDRGNDKLDGGAGNDRLIGGEGDDTYLFEGQFGRDIVADGDGLGRIKIKNQDLGEIKGTGDGAWKTALADATVVVFKLLDDARSSTGKMLVVNIEGDRGNTITIKNFDTTKATSEVGYLGIRLPDLKLAVAETGITRGASFWSDLNATLSDLDGKQSALGEGTGKSFTVDLSQAARAGDTVTLHLSLDSAAQAKAILGDRKVDADGAVITLEEGQTRVSFALLADGDVPADLSGALNVTFEGGGKTAASNSWGLTLKDVGERASTLVGDYQAMTVVHSGDPITRQAADGGSVVVVDKGQDKFVRDGNGNLVAAAAGVPVTDNVIFGTLGNDHIQGLTGNDALAGGAGNDHLEGGEGDDLIGGGSGSDRIDGGGGNDYISSSAGLAPESQQYGPLDTWNRWGLPAGKTAISMGATWGVYANDKDDKVWSGIGETRTDSTDGDSIDAGIGNDWVLASWGDDYVNGGEGDDEIDGLAGADIIEGGPGDDSLTGDGIVPAGYLNSVDASLHGSDFIDGGAGDDQMTGGGGNDNLFGGAGADKIFGDTGVASGSDFFVGLAYHGADYIDGEDGDDYLEGDGGSDTLYGGAGNDTLKGDQDAERLSAGQAADTASWGDDYLDGEDGDDLIWGNGGDDVLHGGAGNDQLVGDETGGALVAAAHGDDYLDGEDGDDVLVGGGRNDTLYGGSGNDQLIGDETDGALEAQAHGEDFLDGEDGDDTLVGGGKDDTLYGGAGNDLLWGDESGPTLDGAAQGNDYLDGGEGDDQLVGGGKDDILIGGAGNDHLFGDDALGNVVAEFQGKDYLDGGEGDDYLEGGGGDDTLIGGNGRDTLKGGPGANRLDAGEGDDFLEGESDDNVMLGGGGNDQLNNVGGNNNDMDGGDGDDHLFSVGDANTLRGGEGNDELTIVRGSGNTLDGGIGDDLLVGRDQDNILVGGDGDDRLYVTGNDNVMRGGAGSDQLWARGSNNLLDGGDGDDLYVFEAGFGVNRIADSGAGGGGNAVRFYFDYAGCGMVLGVGSLKLSFANGDELHIDGFDPDDPLNSTSVKSFVFDDQNFTLEQLLAIGSPDITGTPEADALQGTPFRENIYGLAGDDVIDGGAGNDLLDGGEGDDTLIGGSGDDTLDGGAGSDTMLGGRGNDIYWVRDSQDVIVENAAEGTDKVLALVDYALTENVENLDLFGGDASRAIGNGRDNIIRVSFGGDAYIDGQGGDDSLMADQGHLIGGDGNDVLRTYQGNSLLEGGAGNDVLTAGGGNDVLIGGAGADVMDGGAGADTYEVDDAGDVIIESDSGPVNTPSTGGSYTVADVDTVRSSISYTLGANLEQLNLTGEADIDGTGNEANNVMVGNDGRNLIAGGGGADALYGGGGDDRLLGGDAADSLDGGTGADIMEGGAGADVYYVDDAGDQIIDDAAGHIETYTYTYGGSTYTVSYYTTDYETVYSSVTYTLGANLEWLCLTGTGAIDGGGNELANTLSGNDASNVLRGGAGNDSLLGNGGDDQLFGGDGDDTLEGGAGADLLAGGAGDDTYRVDDAEDQILELPDEGYDRVDASVDFTLGSNIEALDLMGGAVRGRGNDLQNSIRGNALANVLEGMAGGDWIDGGPGNDAIDGGAGDDDLRGGADGIDAAGNWILNDDLLAGGEGNDDIDGGSGNDLMYGGAGDDTLYGGRASGGEVVGPRTSNADTIYGDEGDDQIDGGEDADRLYGGDGNDLLYGGDGWQGSYDDVVRRGGGEAPYSVMSNDDYLDGGAGDDELYGQAGNDVVLGGTGADHLDGGSGDDVVDGGADDDVVMGGDGNDVVLGGAGADHLDGGRGDDIIAGGAGSDVALGGEGNDVLYSSHLGGSAASLDIELDPGSANPGGGTPQGTGDSGAGVPDITLDVASVEEDGSIGQANLLDQARYYNLTGYIGDRPGYTGGPGWGDVDMYRLSGLAAGQTISIATFSNFDAYLGLYDAAGTLVASNDDAEVSAGSSNNLDSAIVYTTGAPGDYFIAMSDFVHRLPSDPFDPSSVTYGSYLQYGPYTIKVDTAYAMSPAAPPLPEDPGPVHVGQVSVDTAYLDDEVSVDELRGGAGDDIYVVDGFYEKVDMQVGGGCGDWLPAQRLLWTTDDVIELADEGHDIVVSSASFVLGDNIEELRLVFDPDSEFATPPFVSDLRALGQDGIGNGLDNVITGNALKNRLDGGAGDDVLVGWEGDDTYVIDSLGDVIVERVGEGVDTVESYLDYALEDANLENLTLLGSAGYGGGNAADNMLIGNEYDNTLEGLGGNDELVGGAGNDALAGGEGDDRYVFRPGDGQDWITDWQGSDTLVFEGGVTVEDIDAYRFDDGLVLTIAWSGEGAYIDGWFVNDEGIDQVEFCDGSALDRYGILTFIDRPPEAQDDVMGTDEDAGPLLIAATALLANDSDPDGDAVEVVDIQRVSDAGNAVTIDSQGDVRFELGDRYQFLSAGRTAVDRFSYTIADRYGKTSTAVVELRIAGINDAPVARTDAAAVSEDGVLGVDGNVLANDSDVDAGTVLQLVSPGLYNGQYGDLQLASDGSYAYALHNDTAAVQALAEGATVVETFDYRASDGMADAAAVLSISVTGHNDAPTLVAPIDDQAAAAGAAFSYQVGETVFTDVDAGDALSYSAARADGQPLPAWLQFDAASRSLSGTPANGDAGDVAVMVTAADNWGATAADTFVIGVASTPDVGEAGCEGGGSKQRRGRRGDIGTQQDHGEVGDREDTGRFHPLPDGRRDPHVAGPGGQRMADEACADGGEGDLRSRHASRGAHGLQSIRFNGTNFARTSDNFLVKERYRGEKYCVEQFRTVGERPGFDGGMQSLVQAMAAFAPPAAGQGVPPDSYMATLNPVLASNWQ